MKPTMISDKITIDPIANTTTMMMETVVVVVTSGGPGWAGGEERRVNYTVWLLYKCMHPDMK